MLEGADWWIKTGMIERLRANIHKHSESLSWNLCL